MYRWPDTACDNSWLKVKWSQSCSSYFKTQGRWSQWIWRDRWYEYSLLLSDLVWQLLMAKHIERIWEDCNEKKQFWYLYLICCRCNNRYSVNPSSTSENIFWCEHGFVVSKELVVKGQILCFHQRPPLHKARCFINSQIMFYGYLTLLIMFIHFCVNESSMNKVCTYITVSLFLPLCYLLSSVIWWRQFRIYTF